MQTTEVTCEYTALTFCPSKVLWDNIQKFVFIAYRWVHRESNLMFILSSDEDQTKNSFSLSVNEPQQDYKE